MTRSASAAGLATIAADGSVLDAWFPSPRLGDTPMEDPVDVVRDAGSGVTFFGTSRVDEAVVVRLLGETVRTAIGHDPVRNVSVVPVSTTIALDEGPLDAYDAYLRLHLLSHRLIRPHGCEMDGIFGVLNNVVWTSAGPCAVDRFEATRLRLRASGQRISVYGIDKFPRMVDYVVPSGVRIADADRVRLGAHLGEGTVVMHEGFVNFNAGTLGKAMVEGRISGGVVVGNDSDIGGGASIMGTLSGGGKEVIAIGERCLLGANAGVGISLGDDCVVEAGLYITAGTRVTAPDGQVVKASALSGTSGLLYLRNSETGRVEARQRTGTWGGLNAALHA